MVFFASTVKINLNFKSHPLTPVHWTVNHADCIALQLV